MQTSHRLEIESLNVMAPPVIGTAKRRAIAVAVLFAIGSVVCFVLDTRQALQAYLVGFVLFLSFTLGSMGWLMLWHLTSGRWGLPMRRIWEAATRNIPYAAVAFLPILFGYRLLYAWVNPTAEMQQHLHSTLVHYLNYPFFVVRAVAYFASWFLLIWLLNRWSAIQDRPYSGWLGRKFNIVSSAGILIYFWTMTFASIDWIMSLLPGWPSTIFSLIVIIGQGILGMALAINTVRLLKPYEPMNVLVDDIVLWDNGKLLLAFVMLWAYLSYSQWLIIWAGNLPEEIRWYIFRLHGGWGAVALFIVIFHFAVPFSILLSQSLKKNVAKLSAVAAWLIFMRGVDLFWWIAPSFSPEHVNRGVWMYAVIPVAMVALWFALFFSNLTKRPLVAVYDPRVNEVYGEVHG